MFTHIVSGRTVQLLCLLQSVFCWTNLRLGISELVRGGTVFRMELLVVPVPPLRDPSNVFVGEILEIHLIVGKGIGVYSWNSFPSIPSRHLLSLIRGISRPWKKVAVTEVRHITSWWAERHRVKRTLETGALARLRVGPASPVP